jgi:hypothetical protein
LVFASHLRFVIIFLLVLSTDSSTDESSFRAKHWNVNQIIRCFYSYHIRNRNGPRSNGNKLQVAGLLGTVYSAERSPRSVPLSVVKMNNLFSLEFTAPWHLIRFPGWLFHVGRRTPGTPVSTSR